MLLLEVQGTEWKGDSKVTGRFFYLIHTPYFEFLEYKVFVWFFKKITNWNRNNLIDYPVY